MRSFTLSTLALAATASFAAAEKQDGPFNLKIVDSTNSTLNGKYLLACHAGAAQEGLCIGETKSKYYYNSSSSDSDDGDDKDKNKDKPQPGTLIYKLPISGNENLTEVPSPLDFIYNPLSNVAVPLFSPSDSSGIQVGFDKDDKLYVYGNYDDSNNTAGTMPPTPPDGGIAKYNWEICYTQVGGYYYQALAWVTAGDAHNPTCHQANVTKVDADDKGYHAS